MKQKFKLSLGKLSPHKLLWQVAIAPGDEAIVKVYYDPNVHKDLAGPVTRTVSIHSNDPVDFETKLTITLDQEK